MIYGDVQRKVDQARLLRAFEDQGYFIQHGRQGDAWIWVDVDGVRVEIDTFTSAHFRVRGRPGIEAAVGVVRAMLEEAGIGVTWREVPQREGHDPLG